MKHLGLKVFSILVATLLYWFVNSESNSSSQMLSVPVHFKNIPNGKVVMAPLQPRAQVLIKGPNSLVAKLGEVHRVFEVSIPARVENEYSVSLKPEDLGLEPYFSVLKIEPSVLELTFDNLVTRELPVKVPTIGALRQGVTLESVIAIPAKVKVIGPETELKVLSELESYPLDLRGVEGPISRVLNLKEMGALVELTPKHVTVNVQVNVLEDRQVFEQLPIEVRARPGAKYAVAPPLIKVTVAGPIEQIAALKREEVVPYVRVREGSDIGQNAPVLVELPQGLRVAAVEPESVALTLEKSVSPPSPSEKSKTKRKQK